MHVCGAETYCERWGSPKYALRPMPGAHATGRFAPAPMSTEAMRLLAAVAVTRSRRTFSCARSMQQPWQQLVFRSSSCLLAAFHEAASLGCTCRFPLLSCHTQGSRKGPLTMQAA